MTKRTIILATCLLLGLPGVPQAFAQAKSSDDTTKLADEIITCSALRDAAARLKCYDDLAQPLLGLQKSTEPGEAAALEKFTGKDDWDSDVLEIDKPWRLVWQNQGSLLTVELHTPQGEMLNVIGNQIGQGGGRSEVLDPGNYRLAVRGLGGWRIQVVSDEGG